MIVLSLGKDPYLMQGTRTCMYVCCGYAVERWYHWMTGNGTRRTGDVVLRGWKFGSLEVIVWRCWGTGGGRTSVRGFDSRTMTRGLARRRRMSCSILRSDWNDGWA